MTHIRCPHCHKIAATIIITEPAVTHYNKLLDMHIQAYPWPEESTRILNALINQKIATFLDLCKCTEAELLRMPNFGRKSLEVIKRVLAEHNLNLGTIE